MKPALTLLAAISNLDGVAGGGVRVASSRLARLLPSRQARRQQGAAVVAGGVDTAAPRARARQCHVAAAACACGGGGVLRLA